MRKDFVVLICLLLLALMTGCNDSSDRYGDDGLYDYVDGSPGGNGRGGNNSPVARITSPAEGSIFTVGEVIQFVGSCRDSEDGALTGASLVWMSDRDGQIDTGETCSSTTLSAGAHQITLTATDSDGADGMDTMAITVNATSASGDLPDTGQTASYTDTFGEDSDYIINPPAYTKLDASGSALDAGAADWAMVRDDVTDLIWEVKTDDSSIHDKDDAYSWQDAKDVFIAQLNSDNFGGYSDWRLPTIKELSILAHPEFFAPAINPAYFPENMPDHYMSSTTHYSIPVYAWTVNFYNGDINQIYKPNSHHVRAVRGGQSAGNLQENGDGTVTDRATGLMWQQAEAGAMTWEAGLAYCETLALAGYDDWRLPNRHELQSILDYGTELPSIDTVFFPGTDWIAPYWSSTTYSEVTDIAWYVVFRYGMVYATYKAGSYNIRAVRGGQ